VAAPLKLACLAVALLVAACGPSGMGEGGPDGDMVQPPQVTPPSQGLLEPGEPVEGELGEGEVDRWIFATTGGRLATVEVWCRPATASGPEAEVGAFLVGPDGATVTRADGTVTLPPYIVEEELRQTGSYLLWLEASSGRPGRYTLLVTLSEERSLTRPEVYTGTLSLDESPAGAGWLSEDQGFTWPSPRRAISGWYFRDPANPGHNGLDIAADMYDPISAAAAGTVSFAEFSGGYGNLVILKHAGGWQTWYAHLSLFSVTAEQEVQQGEVVGAAGSTGYSTGPHLHFELRYQGEPVDPLVYLQ
jgi:hypothetical protein